MFVFNIFEGFYNIILLKFKCKKSFFSFLQTYLIFMLKNNFRSLLMYIIIKRMFVTCVKKQDYITKKVFVKLLKCLL